MVFLSDPVFEGKETVCSIEEYVDGLTEEEIGGSHPPTFLGVPFWFHWRTNAFGWGWQQYSISRWRKVFHPEKWLRQVLLKFFIKHKGHNVIPSGSRSCRWSSLIHNSGKWLCAPEIIALWWFGDPLMDDPAELAALFVIMECNCGIGWALSLFHENGTFMRYLQRKLKRAW